MNLLAKLTQMLVNRNPGLRQLRSLYLPATFWGQAAALSLEFAPLRAVCAKLGIKVVYEDYFAAVNIDSQVLPAFWKAHRRSRD